MVREDTDSITVTCICCLTAMTLLKPKASAWLSILLSRLVGMPSGVHAHLLLHPVSAKVCVCRFCYSEAKLVLIKSMKSEQLLQLARAADCFGLRQCLQDAEQELAKRSRP